MIDREKTLENLIMVVVSLILEIKKSKLYFRRSILKNIKTTNHKVNVKDTVAIISRYK